MLSLYLLSTKCLITTSVAVTSFLCGHGLGSSRNRFFGVPLSFPSKTILIFFGTLQHSTPSSLRCRVIKNLQVDRSHWAHHGLIAARAGEIPTQMVYHRCMYSTPCANRLVFRIKNIVQRIRRSASGLRKIRKLPLVSDLWNKCSRFLYVIIKLIFCLTATVLPRTVTVLVW